MVAPPSQQPPPVVGRAPAEIPERSRSEEDIIYVQNPYDHDDHDNTSETSRGGVNGETNNAFSGDPTLPPRRASSIRNAHDRAASAAALYEDEVEGPNDWWGIVSHELQLAMGSPQPQLSGAPNPGDATSNLLTELLENQNQASGEQRRMSVGSGSGVGLRHYRGAEDEAPQNTHWHPQHFGPW